MIIPTQIDTHLTLKCHIKEYQPIKDKKETFIFLRMRINEFTSQVFKTKIHPQYEGELQLFIFLSDWKHQYDLGIARNDFNFVPSSQCLAEGLQQFSQANNELANNDPEALMEEIDLLISKLFYLTLNPVIVMHEMDLMIGRMFRQTLDSETQTSWITRLTLSGNAFTRHRLKEILSLCPKLESLTLKKIHDYSLVDMQNDFYYLSTVETFRYDPNKLNLLDISYQNNLARDISLTITASSKIFGNPLKELTLDNCDWVNLRTIKHIVTKNPSLQKLSCIRCGYFITLADIEDGSSSQAWMASREKFLAELPKFLKELVINTNSSLVSFTTPNGNIIQL